MRTGKRVPDAAITENFGSTVSACNRHVDIIEDAVISEPEDRKLCDFRRVRFVFGLPITVDEVCCVCGIVIMACMFWPVVISGSIIGALCFFSIPLVLCLLGLWPSYKARRAFQMIMAIFTAILLYDAIFGKKRS